MLKVLQSHICPEISPTVKVKLNLMFVFNKFGLSQNSDYVFFTFTFIYVLL